MGRAKEIRDFMEVPGRLRRLPPVAVERIEAGQTAGIPEDLEALRSCVGVRSPRR